MRNIFLLAIFLFSSFLFFEITYAKTLDDPFVEQWAYTDINVYSAWDYTLGSQDVVVAVIDNGFDTFHPDLFTNVWKNVDEISNNQIDDDKNGYVDDVWGWSFVSRDTNSDGLIDESEERGNNNPRPQVDQFTESEKNSGVFNHGTLVAGIIGAVGNNKKNGSGVSPNVKLMNIQVVDEGGSGSFARLPDAIYYAVYNGANIINMSVVGDITGDVEKAIDYAYGKGVVMVAAAGNSASDLNDFPLYPICFDAGKETNKVLGVSAISASHNIASFSNIGSNCVDITAPGENIFSTVRYSPKYDLNEQYTGGWSGTSFSAPLVSGAAALIKSIKPNWAAKNIYKALLSTTHHTPSTDVYSNLFGTGLLQIDKAVQYALNEVENSKFLKNIIVVNGDNGDHTSWDFNTGDDDKVLRERALSGIDDFSFYQYLGKTFYVTAKSFDKTRWRISLYDADWKKIDSFIIEPGGEISILVADVMGDVQPEIVVAPKGPSNTLFDIYSLEGEDLYTHILENKHNGVSFDKFKTEGSNKYDLVVLYELDDKLTMETLSGEGFSKNKFFLDSFSKADKVSVMNLDSDDQMEYVVGGGLGERPLVVFYDHDGSIIKKFLAYGSYKKSFSFIVGDYNYDGEDELVTIPKSNDQPVRVWNKEGKKVAQKYFFTDFKTNNIISVPIS